MTLSLEAFRATGVPCNDIGAALRDDCLMGSVGRIYLDCLYIEHWVDGRHGVAPANGATWLLTLGNEQSTGELAFLESRLFDWARDEGYSL